MTRPLIGICTDHVRHFPAPDRDRSYLKLYPQYCTAVIAAGGTPLVMPIVPEVDDIRPLLALVQGVIMIGADDYPSEWYGRPTAATDVPVTPQRAAFDRDFAHMLYNETDLPVLGICGGMQLATILTGGTLIQDLPQGGAIEHRAGKDGYRSHFIDIDPDSVLAAALGTTRLEVNSLHHQAAESVGDRLRISARAEDGVIEGIEFRDHPFRIGVQWHPERMIGNPHMQRMFEAFTAAARARMALPA